MTSIPPKIPHLMGTRPGVRSVPKPELPRCPYCGRNIEKRAGSCPGCGAPVATQHDAVAQYRAAYLLNMSIPSAVIAPPPISADAGWLRYEPAAKGGEWLGLWNVVAWLIILTGAVAIWQAVG